MINVENLQKLMDYKEAYDDAMLDLEERREELFARATKVTTSLTGMPRGGKGSREDTYCDLVNLHPCFGEVDFIEFHKLLKEAYDQLMRIPDPFLRAVLSQRYILGKTPGEMMGTLMRSRPEVYRLIALAETAYYQADLGRENSGLRRVLKGLKNDQVIKADLDERWRAVSALLESMNQFADMEGVLPGFKTCRAFLYRTEQSIKREIHEIDRMRMRIAKGIQNLDNEAYRAILYYKYLEGYTYEEFEDLTDASVRYSIIHIKRLHEKAIAELEQVLNENK